jgi:hypothetical protein
MGRVDHLIELREYCRQKKWPRLPQWQHWIYAKNPVAIQCVKKIGGRYLIDLEAFENYLKNATLGD